MNRTRKQMPETLILNRIASTMCLTFAACLMMAGMAITTWADEATAPPADEIEAILERFVEDYKLDPSLRKGTFGIHIEKDQWYVKARPATDSQPASVTLHHSSPAEPTWYFTIDEIDTLRKMDRRELNPGTASVAAFSHEATPLDVETMDGYQPGPGFTKELFATLFHFWTRGLPEVIPYGERHTRFTHGTDAVVFYYQAGFRSGWFSLKKGQHANKDPRSQVNEFQSLLVITRGTGTALIGGVETILKEGESVFIPEGVSHEFWNDNEEPMQGVLLMFGENA